MRKVPKYHVLTPSTAVSYFLGRQLFPGPKVIELFSSSIQLSVEFILLIDVKMPTSVGILTFISRRNTSPESLKARNTYTFQHFSFMSS